MHVSKRPYLTTSLPGIGGEVKQSPEDFVVEEIPAYTPSGEGQHAYLWVEKREIAGAEMLNALAAHFGVDRRDIGAAGIKDKHAITRQWVSLPFHELEADSPDALVGPVAEGLRVLEANVHKNKLRRGHLKGNRFRVVLRDLEVPVDEALDRAQAILAVLADGLPNYYGLQRFGIDGGTLQLGAGLLGGRDDAHRRVRRNRFLKRLAINSVQSELYNRVLARRLEEGLLRQVLTGDVMQKTDTGGMFVCKPVERDETQARLDRGELVITGPMFGPRMMAPVAEASQLERQVAAAAEVDVRAFRRFQQLAPGDRRPLLVELGEVSVEPIADEQALAIGFSLPSGSYATVALREITKVDDTAERPEE